MVQIALETSNRSASICLLERSTVIGEHEIGADEPTTAALLPAIERLLGDAAIEPAGVDLVSISIGPGSFTGLRMGVAFAKTFAYAVGCQILAVSTHRVVACQVALDSQTGRKVVERVATAIDAQRGQWFVQQHRVSAGGIIELDDNLDVASIADPEEFLGSFCGGDVSVGTCQPTVVCGPALARLQQKWNISDNLCVADKNQCRPTARTVGWIAANHPDLGKIVDPFELAPTYGRKSAAEEKYEQRTKT